MGNPAQPLARESHPYADAALLVVPQVVMWPFAFFCVTLHRFAGDACPGPDARVPCDYELEYAANVGYWIALPVIAVVTFVALVVWQKRGWRRWPVALAGIGLMLLAIYTAIQLIQRALLAI